MLPNTDSLGVTTKLNYGDMELQYDSPFPSVSPTLGTIEFSKTAQEIFCEGEPILGSPSLVPADVFPPLGDLGACDDDSGVNNANKENQQPNMARHGPQSSFIPGGIINRRAFSCSPSREHSLLLTADDSAEYSPLVEAGLFESAEKCEKELRPTSDSANWSGSSADGRVDVGKSEHQNSEDLHGTRQKDAEMNDKNRDRENNSLSCFQVSTAPRFDKSDLPFQDNKDVEVTEVPVQTHLQTDTYEAEVMKPPGTLPEPAEAIQAPFEPNGTNFISVSEHMTQSELSPHLKVNSQSISHSQQNRVDQFRFLAQSEMVTEPSQFTQDVPYRPQDQSNLNRISLCSEDEKQNRKRGTRRDKGRPPNPPSRRRKPNGTGFIVAATAKKEEHHQEPDPGTLPSTGGTSPASTTPSAQTILPTSDSRQGPCEARHSTQKARKNIAVPSEIAASDHHLDNLSRTAPASSGTSYLTKPAPAPATKGATSTTSKRRGKPRNPETAHLTLEQKRILRAKRNRESAEKSRNRRKLQTETLEKSVAQLRDENRELSAEMLKLQTQLESLSSEVAQAMTVGHEQEGLRERTPALYDAIEAVQKVMIDCPRTFLRSSHTPEIQLKIHKQRKKK